MQINYIKKHIWNFVVRQKVFVKFIFAGILISLLTYQNCLLSKIKQSIKEQEQIILKVNTSSKLNELSSKLNELSTHFMALEVEKLTQHLESDAEKSIAIARWIAAHIANNITSGSTVFSWFQTRTGLCGARAQIFVKMLSLINIPARVFNIYNFPYPGCGHSCVQAFYENKWHYFDVTYAGYFIKDNDVLSWEEIKHEAFKGNHMRYLYVFDETIDRYGNIDDELINKIKVNNKERMALNYKRDSIINANSYGFYGKDKITLFIDVDLSNVSSKLVFGGKNYDYKTLETLINNKLSMCLGTIGSLTDNFIQNWNFHKLEVGKIYSIKFYTYKKTRKDLQFWAKGNSLSVIKGENFCSNSDIWEIKFIPHNPDATLIIGYDHYHHENNNQGIYLNMIEIQKPN